jgi:AcrR family transcriptional regulator
VVTSILDATLEELALVGFAALNVETVAERAGVNKTTVYRRYPTKVELTAAALLREHETIEDIDTGSFEGDLSALLTEASRFCVDSRGQSVFRMLLADPTNPEVSRLADQMRRDGERVPRRVFQRAIARSEISPDTDLSLLLGMVIGIVVHRVLLERGTLSEEEVQALVSMIVHGVGAKTTEGRKSASRSKKR